MISKKPLSLLVLLLFPLLTGCQNLADQNEKLREQISSLQKELVEVKTDKKVLEERLAKIEVALPPELRETLFADEKTALKEEGLNLLKDMTDRIPSRDEIMQYLDRNIASLVAEDPREGNAWRVNKISFIPPDIAYVDFTDTVVERRILIQYSLDQRTGINTDELAIFHKKGDAWDLVSGKNVDHGGSLIVFTHDPESGRFVQQDLLPKSDTKRVDPPKENSAPQDETPKEPVSSGKAIHPEDYRIYENSWHAYEISYPSTWYFWGMGKTKNAIFRTGFSPDEVQAGSEAVIVDVVSGSSLEDCASPYAGTQKREQRAGRSTLSVVGSGRTTYIFEKSDSQCLIISGQSSFSDVVENMVSSLRLN